MENTATFKDYFKLHAVILVWGFTGILGKVISIPSVSIVWYRTLIAVLSLLIFLIIKRKNLLVSSANLAKYFGVGIIIALHWVFFFEALKVSTVSVTLTTLASATLFTSILEPLFFRKKIVPYEILFGSIVIGGLIMIFNFEADYQLGIIYSLISAFCASLFTTINGVFISNEGSAIKITLYEMLGAVLIITMYLGLTGNFNLETLGLFNQGMNQFWLDLFYLLILGIICTSIAFVISVEVMKKLTPFTVSISINMEPIYAIILALFFFGESEKMSFGFYIGAAMVMATIFGNGIMKKLKKK
jgi:drug/metabolite transporter (DMT)-like permease